MLNIRNATLSDAEKIAQIWARGWIYAYTNVLSPEFLANRTNNAAIAKKVEKVTRHIRERNDTTDIFMVICDDDNVIGYIEGGTPESPECRADSELDELYIDTKYIGRGIGKILLKKFASEMRTRGAKTFGLMCFTENKSMQFYAHMGGHRYH